MRFSRTRGRYERQGILVETAGLEKAEQECTADADDAGGGTGTGGRAAPRAGSPIWLPR